MIEFEQGINPPVVEARPPMPKEKIPTSLRSVAGQLSEIAVNTFISSKDASYHFLERLWYNHTAALFILESVAIRSLSLVDPSFTSAAKKLSDTLWYASVATLLEDAAVRFMRRFPVGEHMDVAISHFKSPKKRVLDDGMVIYPGTKIGLLSFARNIPIMGEKEGLVSFTKRLYQSGENSLKELALLCETDDPRLEGVEFFYGSSHIAPLAKSLGFDVFEISNPLKRGLSNLLGKRVVHNATKKNLYWQRLAHNYKSPKEVFISREKLVALFGSTPKAHQIDKIPA